MFRYLPLLLVLACRGAPPAEESTPGVDEAQVATDGSADEAVGAEESAGELPAVQVDRVAPMDGPPRTEPLRRVILHATGGPSCDPAVAFVSGTLDGIVRYFETRDDGVSIHYVIGRDGTLVSMVPEDRIASHALGNNDDSLGIELINNGDGADPYPQPQLDVIEALVVTILAANELTAADITTHAAVDDRFIECVEQEDGTTREVVNRAGRGVRRSQDPGANFPLEALRERVAARLTPPEDG
jgi:hypothetical protein